MPGSLYKNTLQKKSAIFKASLNKTACPLLFSIFSLFAHSAYAYEPRFLLWGLAGSERLARIDLLLPIYSEECNCLIYSDIQGEMDTDTNWYGGLGLGYRSRVADRLYGGYLYVDRNYSSAHHAYYILSPGAESLGERWDARVNGYIPVSKKKFDEVGIPFTSDACGRNFNCENSFFIGHQQFIQLFKKTEEVGTGIDAELGGHFGHNRNFSLYGGAFYFHYSQENDLKGLEARVVVPLKPAIALTVEASYDNDQHGAIMAGIRLQGGHVPHTPVVIEDRFYDPIPRNLATIHNGLGAPVSRQQKFDQNLLIRDNIYFFTSTGGSVFNGASSGTFENPLASSQFTQTTVDGIALIAPNANLFFNSGTFIISPDAIDAPNASIALPGGQSIYGRTSDYRCSAVGSERPILLGEIELLEGNNNLDSIQLVNSLVNPIVGPFEQISLTALTILDAPNVSICNSVIDANLTLTPPAGIGFSAFVTGIRLNNSSVTIDTSLINASFNILGDNDETSVAVGIGGIGAPSLDGNVLTSQLNISDSIITASGNVTGENDSSFVVGIGTVATESGITANFANNNVVLTDTQILSSAITGFNQANDGALSSGIGSIASGNAGAVPPAVANFNLNQFTITDSQIVSFANGAENFVLSAGIGGNTMTGVAEAEFNTNSFNITNSQILSSVETTGQIGTVFLFTTAIGGNITSAGSTNFSDNNFTITESQLSSTATTPNALNITLGVTAIGGNSNIIVSTSNFEDNIFSIEGSSITATGISGFGTASFVTAIGGNAVNGLLSPGRAEFMDNYFTITASSLSSSGTKTNGNTNLNFVTVIGGNAESPGLAQMTNMIMTIDSTSLFSQAIVQGTNMASNIATGIGGNATSGTDADIINSTFIVSNSTLDVLAQINGNNPGNNTANGILAGAGTTVDFTTSTGTVSAIVEGTNTGTNNAIAFSGNVIGGGSIQTIVSP